MPWSTRSDQVLLKSGMTVASKECQAQLNQAVLTMMGILHARLSMPVTACQGTSMAQKTAAGTSNSTVLTGRYMQTKISVPHA